VNAIVLSTQIVVQTNGRANEFIWKLRTDTGVTLIFQPAIVLHPDELSAQDWLSGMLHWIGVTDKPVPSG
jgi:hypothetical protein